MFCVAVKFGIAQRNIKDGLCQTVDMASPNGLVGLHDIEGMSINPILRNVMCFRVIKFRAIGFLLREIKITQGRKPRYSIRRGQSRIYRNAAFHIHSAARFERCRNGLHF